MDASNSSLKICVVCIHIIFAPYNFLTFTFLNQTPFP
jgi:hypothetical protein